MSSTLKEITEVMKAEGETSSELLAHLKRESEQQAQRDTLFMYMMGNMLNMPLQLDSFQEPQPDQ